MSSPGKQTSHRAASGDKLSPCIRDTSPFFTTTRCISLGPGVLPSSSTISDPFCSGLEKGAWPLREALNQCCKVSQWRESLLCSTVSQRGKGSNLKRGGDAEGSFKKSYRNFLQQELHGDESVSKLPAPQHEDWGENPSTHVKAGCGVLHL